MEEIELEKQSLKESNDNQNDPKKAPIWAFGMHWPIISGREATWGVLGAVGLPLQIGIYRQTGSTIFYGFQLAYYWA